MKLFVGNLPYDAQEPELERLAEATGHRARAQVVLDRMTGRSKGFAFVDVDGDAGGLIKQLDGSEFHGRRLTVSEARPTPKYALDIPVERNFDTSQNYALLDVDSRMTLVALADTPQDLYGADGQPISTLILPTEVAPTFRTAIRDFEDLVNNLAVSEQDLQDFLEAHPEFLTGDSYVELRPHVRLQSKGGSVLIPDFIMVSGLTNGLSNILELKKPTARIYAGAGNRKRPSAQLSQAVTQMREYRDFFEDNAQREWLKETTGLELFRPEMVLLMGRRSDITPREIKQMDLRVDIRTYDDVIEQARRKL